MMKVKAKSENIIEFLNAWDKESDYLQAELKKIHLKQKKRAACGTKKRRIYVQAA